MHTQSASFALDQDLKITPRLRRFYHSKSIFLPWYWEINSVLTGDLQEDPGIWAAFVCLSGGVKKAWTEAQACCSAFAVAYGVTDFLEEFFVLVVHFQIGQQGQVISCP